MRLPLLVFCLLCVYSARAVTADFSMSSASGCAPLVVDFKDKSAGAVMWEWDFGNGGNKSTKQNPSSVYTIGGTFTVSLTVTDNGGKTSTITKAITVYTSPTAGFSTDITGGCVPLGVRFTDNSTKGSTKIVSWVWDYGDGIQDTGSKSHVHYYQNSGKFTVSLMVKDAAGCTHTITKPAYIKVAPSPIFDFKADDSANCEPPMKVNFKVKVKAPLNVPLTYSWSFGDGTSSTDENPVHTYTKIGIFDVSLSVTDTAGCSYTRTKVDYIQVFKQEASIKVAYQAGCPSRTVYFDNLTKPVVKGMKWYWEYGDGEVSDTFEARHTYERPGQFYPRLITTNLAGCKDTAYGVVKVYTNSEGKPTARFEASPLKGCYSSMKVQFRELTAKYGLQADSCWWDFGDGSFPARDTLTPEHRFNYPGKFTITLRASRGRCTDTFVWKDYIEVLPPKAMFEIYRPCMSDTIYVYDRSIGADEWYFDYGDGYTTTQPNSWHVYSKPGIHIISLRVFNKTTNCWDHMETQVVGGAPDLRLDADKLQGCTPLEVKFTANSGVFGALYRWNFGEGNDTTDWGDSAWVKHVFTRPGKYWVSVQLRTPDSCLLTGVIEIRVAGPDAKFNLTPKSGCVPLTVTLYDSSTSAFRVIYKKYSMGNGDTIDVTGPVMKYTYTKPPPKQGLGYNITETVKDVNGCVTQMSWTVYPTSPAPQLRVIRFPQCSSYKCWFDASVNGLEPFTYKWECSDGSSSDKEIFERIFTKTGIYKVLLTVTDAKGCKDTASITIPVKVGGPEAKFSFTPKESPCPPLSVNFQDQSIPANVPIVKWEWDFGDGSPLATERNPKHIYNIPGKFTPKLYITDSVGCRDSFIHGSTIVIDGPVGSYDIEPKTGCIPLTVTLKAESRDATGVLWDLGDGNFDTSRTLTHTYTKPGQYIPTLLLKQEKATGTCFYALPQKDTITVFAMPNPEFKITGKCFGYPSKFQPLAAASFGTIKTLSWDLGDGFTSSDQEPEHTYEKPGIYTVKLYISNTGDCEASSVSKVKIGGVDARFTTSAHGACIGDPIQFSDKSFADSGIAVREWDFGDGATAISPNPVHTYSKKGLYKVKLLITDYKGCSDTIVIPDFAVGDNTPPKEPVIYRVTVNDDNKIQLEFSKHDDIDLNYYIIYRGDAGGFKAVDSIPNTLDTVYVDNSADVNKSSYCYQVKVRTFCGLVAISKQEHCSVNLKGKPAINSSILNWNAYTGWPVMKYQVYREDVNNLSSYRLLTTVDGNTFTYTDSDIVCYRTHHYRIKAIEEGGLHRISWSNTTEVTPIYIPDVPADEVIRATVENNRSVKVEWSDLPGERIKYYILEKSEDGIKYRPFSNLFSPVSRMYTDDRVDVQTQSYYYRARAVDSCGDAGPYSNIGRSILLKADTTPELYPRLYWSRYISWPEGVRYYDLELKNQSGQFEKIARINGPDSTFIDNITDFNSMKEYCYRVTAYRMGTLAKPEANIGIMSVSNEACVPSRSMIYVPNVFTPNGDGTNDIFMAKGMYISKFSMQIFDRWGTRVFESDNLNEGWDGSYKNSVPLIDAYRYLIVAQGADGRHHFVSGWVTVMR